MEKSPAPVTGRRENSWKPTTAWRTASVKLPNATAFLFSTMAAVKSRAHTPVALTEVETVWDFRPDWVPGPKTPFATPSAMPSSYWMANSIDLATSREW